MKTQDWSVLVELDATDVSDDTHDEVLRALSAHAANTTTAGNGNFAVILSLTAAGPAEAARAAVDLVLAAAPAELHGRQAVGVEVTTEAELERRIASTGD
ncbi:hypothetical protein ACFY00_33070 [Kitasatospora sp. NPDC001540]|uniref:hypothetical protein n=1 Tax=Kitasatospora sp. NPDC001540 TaxID=3364014 RepID=UPI0036879560